MLWGLIEVSWDLTEVSWRLTEVSWVLTEVSVGLAEISWDPTEQSRIKPKKALGQQFCGGPYILDFFASGEGVQITIFGVVNRLTKPLA